MELIPTGPLRELGWVYSKGAEKYTVRDESGNIIVDGSENWRKGLSWMETIGAVKRHIDKWMEGETRDPELNTHHLANAAWGLFSLIEFEKRYPQGDDRPVTLRDRPRIALDLDSVVFDFAKAYKEKFNTDMAPYWSCTYGMDKHLEELKKDKDFWVNMPVLNRPTFEVTCYVTNREIPKEWCMEAIEKNLLPCAPVYTLPIGASKVDVLKEQGIEIFIDDSYKNFIDVNKSGILCYLMDSPQNQYYKVGDKRINDLNQFNEY